MSDILYRIAEDEEIPSPRLIYYEAIIRENTRKAIDLAGGAHRLWPHVKTHKMREMITMQMAMGITRFKCATIKELDMVLSCGAQHVLLAYPLYGPNVQAFLSLAQAYPDATLYALADAPEGLSALSAASTKTGRTFPVMADVNMGMDRTGVPLDRLAAFCRSMSTMPGLQFAGFHAYDGHNGQPSFAERCAATGPALAQLLAVRDELTALGLPVPNVILGGSPSFPCYAGQPDAFLSPGTVFLWDAGYAQKCADLPFVPAAAILTRVISHPATGLFTLDLGYKAIASDPKGVRGVIPSLPLAQAVAQSEEHWVWRMPQGEALPSLGDTLYVISTHICPTTALYRSVLVASGGVIVDEWAVAARDRP